MGKSGIDWAATWLSAKLGVRQSRKELGLPWLTSPPQKSLLGNADTQTVRITATEAVRTKKDRRCGAECQHRGRYTAKQHSADGDPIVLTSTDCYILHLKDAENLTIDGAPTLPWASFRLSWRSRQNYVLRTAYCVLRTAYCVLKISSFVAAV